MGDYVDNRGIGRNFTPIQLENIAGDELSPRCASLWRQDGVMAMENQTRLYSYNVGLVISTETKLTQSSIEEALKDNLNKMCTSLEDELRPRTFITYQTKMVEIV